MNWTEFLLFLCLAYGLYYGVTIAMEMARNNNKDPAETKSAALTFNEEVIPERPDPADFAPLASAAPKSIEQHMEAEAEMPKAPPVKATGGLSLKDLFNSARLEVIEYTRPVSF